MGVQSAGGSVDEDPLAAGGGDRVLLQCQVNRRVREEMPHGRGMQRNASTPGRSAPLNLIQSFATRPPQAPRLSRRPELMERKRTIAVHSKLGVATDLLLQVLGLTIRLRCELLMRVLWMSERGYVIWVTRATEGRVSG